MKTKFKFLSVTVLLLALILGTSSFDIGYLNYYGSYYPIFMERAELERSVSYQNEGREMKNLGKIYYKSPYIYINEKYKGIHVIDNSNPIQPLNTAFIVVPGCLDMAVKGDILYADNSVDLIAFDLSKKTVTKRVKNVFLEPTSPEQGFYSFQRPVGLIIVEWRNR